MTRQEAMEIYKDRSSKFINTQSIQWKMNLSIWTLFALAIFYKGQMHLRWDWVEMVIGVFVIAVHGCFCYRIQKSLDSDKAVKDSIVAQLNSDTKEINVNVNLAAQSNNSPWHWIIIQISITLVLAFIFYASN